MERLEMPHTATTITPVKHKTADRFTKIISSIKESPFFEESEKNIYLYKQDCLNILSQIPENSIDMIFADPPYFLSNGGITCHAGRMVSVNKGNWDKSQGVEENHEFNKKWLAACQRVLTEHGTIWVSGTSHIIFSVGFAMQQLGFKILNDISWFKINPPPNLSCRYFTHSTETIIWAAKSKNSHHHFNYSLMKEMGGGKQMKSLWEIYPPKNGEKTYGKHPTQKPLALLNRIILASTGRSDIVLDPFSGSGTTGVSAFSQGRKYIGIELEKQYLDVSIKRLKDTFREHEKKNC
ncbi:MAG: site-specific DNA-methyltransferase [Candidatus Omnitrophica bacterium]|nr:site-specific DNA-methyltransferase [Candidatus Omnitrophota bacterium]MDD5351625.1 site-specific DNA-methyltransferase [Candidatus Omnitrophota bacterium]MDD5550835.1 site-specific DNA-methyltransferase [Candidatus Omnitrophota bacterium]